MVYCTDCESMPVSVDGVYIAGIAPMDEHCVRETLSRRAGRSDSGSRKVKFVQDVQNDPSRVNSSIEPNVCMHLPNLYEPCDITCILSFKDIKII